MYNDKQGKGLITMETLQYSILRYTPSLVSGETINLAAIFYYPDEDYREFYSITKWKRVESFDSSLSIPLLKDLMLDIKDAVGTALSNSQFVLKDFCAQYQSQLYFDRPIEFPNISWEMLSNQIEEIKKMYFQFEFEASQRPKHQDQKNFLSRLLQAKQIQYKRDITETGKFNDTIIFDYVFGEYGVKFFDLNVKQIKGQTMNKAKTWAWNCKNPGSRSKIIILYDLEDESRADVNPILRILEDSAYKLYNIHSGFSEMNDILTNESL